MFKCPECEFEAKDKRGLGSHRLHAHGVHSPKFKANKKKNEKVARKAAAKKAPAKHAKANGKADTRMAFHAGYAVSVVETAVRAYARTQNVDSEALFSQVVRSLQARL